MDDYRILHTGKAARAWTSLDVWFHAFPIHLLCCLQFPSFQAHYVPKYEHVRLVKPPLSSLLLMLPSLGLWGKHERQLYMEIDVSGRHWFCMVWCGGERRWFTLQLSHGFIMKMNESLLFFCLLIFPPHSPFFHKLLKPLANFKCI